MIGGVVTSAVLGLLLYPVLYVLWRGREVVRPNPPDLSKSNDLKPFQADHLPLALNRPNQ